MVTSGKCRPTLCGGRTNYISAAREPIFTERYRAMSLTLFRGSNQTKRTSMIILPVDRALSIYGALANRSEAKGASTAFRASDENVHRWRRRRTPPDGGRV